MNAGNIGFPEGSFDFVLAGFVGWDYCFDFLRCEFTASDIRMGEIYRVLKDDGQVFINSWEQQGDLDWIEEAIIRHYPAILDDGEFIRRRPIGYSRENATGYEKILRSAGFTKIEFRQEVVDCVSRDEEEWWEQIRNLGWGRFFTATVDQISGNQGSRQQAQNRLEVLKPAILADLRHRKQADGYHFDKRVLFVAGKK